jgi:hypothetical protein
MIEALSSPTDRTRSPRGRAHLPKDPNKSRITNGKLLPDVDGRSAWARRCRDILAEHIADLGGELNTTAALRSIARRSAVLATELELLESQFATAGQATAEQLDLYTRTASALRRLLEALGLERRARDVSPTLSDYFRKPQP